MTRTYDNPLPNNSDAERAILAAGLLSNDAVLEAAAYVKREDFFHESHRLIFSACQQLSVEGKPIDLVTVTDTLQKAGKLQAAGGAAYVSSITDGMPRISNLSHHAKIVRDLARRRQVVFTCAALEQAAMSGEEETSKLLERGASDLLALMADGGTSSMPFTWEEAVMASMDKTISEIRGQGDVMRIPCGIERVDELIGGIRRKDVVLLVGQTSHGKSLLAMQFAIKGDAKGYKGLIFSAEMGKESLAGRELAHTANFPLYLLRRPEKIRNAEGAIADLSVAAAIEAQRKLLVVDTDVTPKRIWSLCEMVKRSKGLDFVVVDYDQLVIRASLSGRDDEFRAQARFMADALALAKRLDVAFILLCQPHKLDDDVARGKKPPRVEQIFGSSAAANTAHVILWVVRKFFQSGMNQDHEGEASVYCLKSRNDMTGKEEIGFNYRDVLFVNDPVPPRVATLDTTGTGRVSRRNKDKKERES